MKKDYLPPGFNAKLIQPLTQIKKEIALGNYSKAFSIAHDLKRMLDTDNSAPFPSYQPLLNSLDMRELLTSLCERCEELKNKSESERDKNLEIIALPMLEAYAHVINMVDLACNGSSDFLQVIAEGIYAERGTIGFFNNKQVYDCKNNLHFSKKNNAEKIKPLAKDYVELTQLLGAFSSERLQALCKTLFSTLDRIEKNDNVDGALKLGEKNLFLLGYIERMISLSNRYKEEYKVREEKQQQSGAKMKNIEDTSSSLGQLKPQ